MSSEKSALVWREILSVFVKTLTAVDKYSGNKYSKYSKYTLSKTIMSETKDFFWIFYCISDMCMKFRAFQKEDEYPTLIICEIIDAERHDYLHV